MNSIRAFAVLMFLTAVVSPPAASAAAEVGQAAPYFSLADQKGVKHSLAALKGKVVVLEWTNPDCPFVQRHYREDTFAALFDKYSGSGVAWLAVNSTDGNTAADSRAWTRKQDIEYPTLIDSLGALGKLYGAKTTPHVFVIDREGRLVYSGAVDDDPGGEKPPAQRTQYLDLAIRAALDGKEPERSETRSYGCPVKYRE
ncbi:redoxin domain-containing protein [bacterium]|nr:redoxin domain-containing protein [bacterium]